MMACPNNKRTRTSSPQNRNAQLDIVHFRSCCWQIADMKSVSLFAYMIRKTHDCRTCERPAWMMSPWWYREIYFYFGCWLIELILSWFCFFFILLLFFCVFFLTFISFFRRSPLIYVSRRSCIRRGGSCDHRRNDCCFSSSCRCNLWGSNCRCHRAGLFQKWG